MAIAVDGSGNAVVTGYTNSTDFPMANPVQPGYGGAWDAFVSKLNPTGSALVYSTFFGAGAGDLGNDMAVDSSGNAYVTGNAGLNFPLVNPVQPAYGGGPYDAFVLKISDQPPKQLASAGPARLWIGLKNSDDQGTQFDLRVELYKNDSALLTTGQTLCITGVTRNPGLAKDIGVLLGAITNGSLATADLLSLKVFTRIGTNPDGTKCSGPGGSHNNAVGLRLYYDSAERPSRFAAQITPDALRDYFLHSGATDFFDITSPPAATPKYKDSAALNFAGGNSWKHIGTWNMFVP